MNLREPANGKYYTLKELITFRMEKAYESFNDSELLYFEKVKAFLDEAKRISET